MLIVLPLTLAWLLLLFKDILISFIIFTKWYFFNFENSHLDFGSNTKCVSWWRHVPMSPRTKRHCLLDPVSHCCCPFQHHLWNRLFLWHPNDFIHQKAKSHRTNPNGSLVKQSWSSNCDQVSKQILIRAYVLNLGSSKQSNAKDAIVSSFSISSRDSP